MSVDVESLRWQGMQGALDVLEAAALLGLPVPAEETLKLCSELMEVLVKSERGVSDDWMEVAVRFVDDETMLRTRDRS